MCSGLWMLSSCLNPKDICVVVAISFMSLSCAFYIYVYVWIEISEIPTSCTSLN